MRTIVPETLPAISRPLAGLVRVAWGGVLVAALAAQLCGLGFVLRNAFRTQPAFMAFGLTSAIEFHGNTTVSPIGRDSLGQRIVAESTIVTLDGRPLPPRAPAEAIARQLRAHGAAVTLRLRDPAGRVSEHRLTRSAGHLAEALRANPIPLTVRIAVRLGFALLGTAALIGSAVLLYRRRPEDPVAVLISFAFLLMAIVIDPPMLLWMGLGLGQVIDGVTGLWWTLIVIAFAAFPSGRFAPRPLRWTIMAAPLLGVLLALDLQSDLVSTAVGVLPPLAVLAAQIHRYRAVGPGIERQQIKWAALGFVAGFVLLGLSLCLATLADQPGWPALARSALNLVVVCIFSGAFAVLPLGLLVSLLHFRLWEADAVIRRSINYAALTLLVGFVFTLAADSTKALIGALIGGEHVLVSTMLGAGFAAAVFAPARSFVLRWSRERFNSPLHRLQALPEQLAAWRGHEDAPELGTRILATIVDAVHADYAALFALTPTGRELVAASNIFDPAALAALRAGTSTGLAWQEVRPLLDEDGPAGTLMLGPRSDRNRFNRSERDALDDLALPIAEALRIARRRTRADLLHELELRLSRLEGPGAARPA